MSAEDTPHLPNAEVRADREAELKRQEAELVARAASRRRRRKIIISAVIFGMVLVGITTEVVRRALARARVTALIEAVRQRREPSSMSEIEAAVSHKARYASSFLGSVYEEIYATEKEHDRPFSEWRSTQRPRRRRRSSPPSAPPKELLAKAMKIHANSIRRLRRGWEDSTFVPESGSRRARWIGRGRLSLVDLLLASARFETDHDRPNVALDDISRALRVTEIIGEHGRISYNDDSLEDICGELQRITLKGEFDQAQIRKVMASLDGLAPWTLAEHASTRNQARIADIARDELSRWLSSATELREIAEALEQCASALALSRELPWVGLAKAADGQVLWAPVTLFCFARMQARRDIARVGLALEFYRSEKGEYPASLDALAPEYLKEVPPDSLTGKPLVYAVNGEGFTVYSVGFNASRTRELTAGDKARLRIPWTGGERASEGEAGR